MPQYTTLITLWSDWVFLSVLIWLCLILGSLYLARHHVHGLLASLGRGAAHGLRSVSRLLLNQAKRQSQRNRELLLAVGEEFAARGLERDFQRVQEAVARDLARQPAVQHRLSEQIARIDSEYRQAADVPPEPPAWLDAVAAVAAVDAKGDPALAKILQDMHGTLEASCHNALLEYRATSRRRHLSLKRMQPYWRRLANTLGEMQRSVAAIESRGQSIDRQMAQYRELRAAPEHKLRALNGSSLARFLIAGLMLTLAALGATVNYRLIASPLASLALPAESMSLIGLFLVAAQLGAGLVLTELSGLTRMFSRLTLLPDRPRRRLAWIAGGLVVALAGLEAGLVYLSYLPVSEPGAWLPLSGHVVMTLVVALLLSSAALPLEAFIQYGRVVAGRTVAAALGLAGLALRLGAVFSERLCQVLIRLYDLIICLPLWLEARVRRSRKAAAPTVEPVAAEETGQGRI